MGSQYKWISVTPQDIIKATTNPIGKKFAEKLLKAFNDNNLTYKVRAAWFPKSSPEWGYTVHFYINKNKEAIIFNINTVSIKIQLRIKDLRTFEKLDDYSENIRNAILNGEPSDIPSGIDADSDYVFIYHGQEYRKKYQLSNNFIFHIQTDNDADSLISIIYREIDHALSKTKI